MKKMMIAAVVLLMSTPLFAQNKNFIDQPYIEVTGRAEQAVDPDEIYVRIVLNEQDSKGKISILQQEKELFRRLNELGLDPEKNLTVQNMNSDLWRRDEVANSKIYQMKVTNATQLSHLFQTLQTVGVSDASIQRMAYSKIEELNQQLRAEAAKNARANAEVLAAALGQSLGRPLYVQDYGDGVRESNDFAPMNLMAKSVTFAGSAAPTLEFKKITVNHSVFMRFAF